MKEQLEEIGEIGVRTVDGDKLQLEAEAFEQISEDKIRIWFRFPGGKSIYEEFTEPTPWDIFNNKLARLIDHSHIQASNFTKLFDPDGPELLFQSYATHISHEELIDLRESSPNKLQFEEDIPSDESEYKNGGRNYPISTWKTVDPKELVEDDRYEEPKNENKTKQNHSNNSTSIAGKVLTYYLELTIGSLVAIVAYKMMTFIGVPLPPLPF